MKKLNKKGFTIVELVIVIAVIAILAAVLIPTFSGVVGRAQQSAALQTAKSTLSNALVMSSTAQLNGTTSDRVEKTVFVIDGYAFRYTGNQLESYTYPSKNNPLKKDATMEKGNQNNFNAILISSDNLIKTGEGENVSYSIADSIYNVIVDVANVSSSKEVKLLDDTYYLNYVAEKYQKTTDTTIVSGKKYYTQSGTDSNFTYTLVDEPNGSSINTYYEFIPASWDAKVFVNSDFSNKVVVFTTFG